MDAVVPGGTTETGAADRIARTPGVSPRDGRPLDLFLALYRLRIVLTVGSVAVVDMGITGIFIAVSQNPDVLAAALVFNLSFFVGLGPLGAYLLARPLRGFRASGGRQLTRASGRLRALPALAALWVVVVTIGYTLTAAHQGVFMPDRTAMAALDQDVVVLATFWFTGLYAILYGFYTFFAVADVSAAMRGRLHRDYGISFPPLPGRIITRLAAVLVVVAGVPPLLFVLDLTVFQPLRAAQGLSVCQTLVLDLFSMLFTISVGLFFVSRSLSKPVEGLIEATARVRLGDLAAEAPVSTDGEIGRLAESFNVMTRGLRERELLHETLGRYVSTDVADRIVRHQGKIERQNRIATVMFTDIEGFTGLAETMTPEATMDLLNEYFDATTSIIVAHGGLVSAFIGDAICALFNLPAEDPDHARNAIRAAVDMQQHLNGRLFQGRHELCTRIGISTGNVVAGTVGGRHHQGYTVHGDAVNLAARLEELNKHNGTRILLSEATVALAGPVCPYRYLGAVPVRGRATPVTVYSIPV